MLVKNIEFCAASISIMLFYYAKTGAFKRPFLFGLFRNIEQINSIFGYIF